MYRAFYYVIAICLIIIGAWLSCINFLNDNTWLARSGSLVVVLGILSVLSSISERRFSKGIFGLSTLVSRLTIAERFSSNQIEESNILNQFKAEAAKLEKELDNEMEDVISKLEAILLIFGTVLWGFGDLPFKLLNG